MAHDMEKGQKAQSPFTTEIKTTVQGAGKKTNYSHDSLAKGTATAPKKNL